MLVLFCVNSVNSVKQKTQQNNPEIKDMYIQKLDQDLNIGVMLLSG